MRFRFLLIRQARKRRESGALTNDQGLGAERGDGGDGGKQGGGGGGGGKDPPSSLFRGQLGTPKQSPVSGARISHIVAD